MSLLLSISPLVWGIILLALFFDFLNGMHDASGAISTVVSTRALSPRMAVTLAAFFNFSAAFFVGVHVATTVGTGLVSPAIITNRLVAAALLGASFWNYFTIILGLPVSSSHSLIGGIVGAGMAKAGTACLVSKTLILTVAFMVLAPPIGFLFSVALMVAVSWIFRSYSPSRVGSIFRVGQIFSSSVMSFAHGAGDSQKTMGVIAVLLFANGYLGKSFYVPWPVIIACYFVMGLGTLAGGWRVVKTMGSKITELKSYSGFCAEIGAGTSILICSLFGIPISTTHVITGSIIGVGASRRLSAVRWGITGKIVWAWILTIPCAGLSAGLIYWLLKLV
jgi:PiT family inorganic phosphate transporter